MWEAVLILMAGVLAMTAGMSLRRRHAFLAPEEERKLLRAPPKERTEAELRKGDIIQHDDSDFVVEGVIRYEEDGHRWIAGRLIDGDKERWLWIDPEGRPAVQLLALTRDTDLSGRPPDAVLIGGIRYALKRRGNANAAFDGNVGEISDHRGDGGNVIRCQFWLYGGAGTDTLIVERWGDQTRVLVGQELIPGVYEFLPGS
jgi:hypothetical protein